MISKITENGKLCSYRTIRNCLKHRILFNKDWGLLCARWQRVSSEQRHGYYFTELERCMFQGLSLHNKLLQNVMAWNSKHFSLCVRHLDRACRNSLSLLQKVWDLSFEVFKAGGDSTAADCNHLEAPSLTGLGRDQSKTRAAPQAAVCFSTCRGLLPAWRPQSDQTSHMSSQGKHEYSRK